jgi:hypothetical protein
LINVGIGLRVRAYSQARRGTPQGDAELMTNERFSASTRDRGLNKSATKFPSERKIANIAQNDTMILPYDPNSHRMEFSERTPPMAEIAN